MKNDRINIMNHVLINLFEISKDDSRPLAEKMVAFLDNKASAWISTTVGSLPEPQDLSELCNTYYMVKVENFGERRAMYCFDQNGEAGWYSSYVDKIIKHVSHYQPEFKLL